MRPHRNRPRRRAAERLLEELDGDITVATPATRDDPELTSMRRITTLLGEVPAGAWQPIPAPGQSLAPSARRHRRPLTRSQALSAAVALVCLAIGLAGGALINRGASGPASDQPSHAATTTLRPLPGQSGRGVARVQLTPGGRIVISFARLPLPGTGRFYEAWLMTSATKLISVASFRPDARGRARVETILPAAVGAFRYIDLSLQRARAGPAHSGDSVLRGPTAPLTRAHG